MKSTAITMQCVNDVFSDLARWAGREPLERRFVVEILEFLEGKGMADAQLKLAATQWRCKSRFFPCPQDLVNEVFLGVEDKALMEWTAIALTPSGQATEGLSDIGRRALQAVGGRWAIDTTPAGIMRKQFLEMYGAISRKEDSEAFQERVRLLPADATKALPPRTGDIDISGIGRAL